MRERVLPLLPGRPARPRAPRCCSTRSAEPAASRAWCTATSDPSHLLGSPTARVSGVIDWSDTVVGDPALDLAWTLNGTPPAFADAARRRRTASRPTLRARGAAAGTGLGPWWEVLAGVDFLGEEYVESGLAGVLARL